MSQIVVVDGVEHEFPAGMSEAEIKSALQSEYGAPEVPKDYGETRWDQDFQTPVSDFLESAQTLPGRASDVVGNTLENYGETVNRGVDPASTTTGLMADTVMGAGEMMGEVGSTGLEAWQATWGQLGNYVPTNFKEWTYDKMSEVGQWIAESPLAQMGMDAWNTGAEAWHEFEKNHPQDAQQLKDMGVVLSSGAPVDRPLRSTGRKLLTDAAKQKRETKRNLVKEVIEPENKHGAGKTRIENGRKVYDPTERENEVIDAVTDVDGVNPQLTVTENITAVDNEIVRLGEDLDAALDAAGNPEIERASVVDTLKNLVETFDQRDASLTLTGDAVSEAKRILRKAENLVNNSDGTAKGLLQARRELDSWISESTQGNVFDPQMINGRNAAVREIRQFFNNVVDEAVPDAAVKDYLRNMSNLYMGMDMMTPKAEKEAIGRLKRWYQNLHRATGISLPSTPLAQLITGQAAVGAMAAPWAPAVGTSMLGVGLAVGGLKWTASPQARATLGHMLKKTGEALKTVEDPVTIQQLKMDRAYILSLLGEEQEEDGTEAP